MGGVNSGAPRCDDDTFIEMYQQFGPAETARKLNIQKRDVTRRRNRLERKRDIIITSGVLNPKRSAERIIPGLEQHPGRIEYNVPNGVVIIGSDFHYWPGPKSTMHRALVMMCKELKPKLFIANGDVVDMAAVSRHPPIGWEKQPTVKEEIETAQARLDEICRALPGGTLKVWTLGNHDGRFETRLATVAPEYAKLHGVHLRDHFPIWEPCWSCWINGNVVVKHRFKGGDHAPWNNTLRSGLTTITGHLHSAKVIPYTDYNGTRYGVDTGCVAEPGHRAFLDYTEDNPKNWRSAFGVFTFLDGKLLYPELVIKWDEEHFQFRGKIIKV
jgi:hypothetical protein